jgi:hypothetical protein
MNVNDGILFRSIAAQNNLNYELNIILDNVTGVSSFGLSRSKNVLPDNRINLFSFKSGDIYDANNNIVWAYKPLENISISGNTYYLNNNNYYHNYYINNNLVCSNSIYSIEGAPVDGYTFKNFFLETKETAVNFTSKFYGERPSYSIEFNTGNFFGDPITGYFYNNDSSFDKTFEIFDAVALGQSFYLLSGLENTYVSGGNKANIIFTLNPQIDSNTYNSGFQIFNSLEGYFIFDTNFGSFQELYNIPIRAKPIEVTDFVEIFTGVIGVDPPKVSYDYIYELRRISSQDSADVTIILKNNTGHNKELYYTGFLSTGLVRGTNSEFIDGYDYVYLNLTGITSSIELDQYEKYVRKFVETGSRVFQVATGNVFYYFNLPIRGGSGFGSAPPGLSVLGTGVGLGSASSVFILDNRDVIFSGVTVLTGYWNNILQTGTGAFIGIENKNFTGFSNVPFNNLFWSGGAIPYPSFEFENQELYKIYGMTGNEKLFFSNGGSQDKIFRSNQPTGILLKNLINLDPFIISNEISGSVFASEGDFILSEVFSNNQNNFSPWLTSSLSTGFIGFEFKNFSPTDSGIVTHYEIKIDKTFFENFQFLPKTIKLQGSNNNILWTDLDEETDLNFYETPSNIFTVDNTGIYNSIRVLITEGEKLKHVNSVNEEAYGLAILKVNLYESIQNITFENLENIIPTNINNSFFVNKYNLGQPIFSSSNTGVTWEKTASNSLLVSEAGSDEVNGVYTESTEIAGKPSYVKGDIIIYFFVDGWVIQDPIIEKFYYYDASESDVPTPDLVDGWVQIEGFSPTPKINFTNQILDDFSTISQSLDSRVIVAGGNNSPLYISKNFGSSWETKLDNKKWTSSAASFDGKVLSATADNDYIYISKDSGNNWEPYSEINNWVAIDISYDGKNQIAAINQGEFPIYISKNTGVTWTALNFADFNDSSFEFENNIWQSVSISKNSIYALACGYTRAYISENGGDTWFPTADYYNLNDRFWTSSAISNNGQIQLFSYLSPEQELWDFGGVQVSRDFGFSWSEFEISNPKTFFTDIDVSFNGDIIAGGTKNSFLYTSFNTGADWTQRYQKKNWSSISLSSGGNKILAVSQLIPDKIIGENFSPDIYGPGPKLHPTPPENSTLWQLFQTDKDQYPFIQLTGVNYTKELIKGRPSGSRGTGDPGILDYSIPSYNKLYYIGTELANPLNEKKLTGFYISFEEDYKPNNFEIEAASFYSGEEKQNNNWAQLHIKNNPQNIESGILNTGLQIIGLETGYRIFRYKFNSSENLGFVNANNDYTCTSGWKYVTGIEWGLWNSCDMNDSGNIQVVVGGRYENDNNIAKVYGQMPQISYDYGNSWTTGNILGFDGQLGAKNLNILCNDVCLSRGINGRFMLSSRYYPSPIAPPWNPQTRASGRSLLISLNTGQSWSQTGLSGYWNSVAMSNNGAVMCAVGKYWSGVPSATYGAGPGSNTQFRFAGQYSLNTGVTWRVITGFTYSLLHTGSRTLPLASLAMSADGRIIFVGENGSGNLNYNTKLLRNVTSGSGNWVPILTASVEQTSDFFNFNDPTFTSIATSEDGRCVTAVSSEYQYNLYVSHDTGNNWINPELYVEEFGSYFHGSNFTNVSMSSDGKYQILVGTDYYGEEVPSFISKDSGISWEIINCNFFDRKKYNHTAISKSGEYQMIVGQNIKNEEDKIYFNCTFGSGFTGSNDETIKINKANFYIQNSPDSYFLSQNLITANGNNSFDDLTGFAEGSISNITGEGLEPAIFFQTGLLTGFVLPSSLDGIYTWPQDIIVSGTGAANRVFFDFSTGFIQSSGRITINTGLLFERDFLNIVNNDISYFFFYTTGQNEKLQNNTLFNNLNGIVDVLNSGATGDDFLLANLGVTGYILNPNTIVLNPYLLSGEDGNTIKMFKDTQNREGIILSNRYFRGGVTLRPPVPVGKWSGLFQETFNFLQFQNTGRYTVSQGPIDIINNPLGVIFENNFVPNLSAKITPISEGSIFTPELSRNLSTGILLFTGNKPWLGSISVIAGYVTNPGGGYSSSTSNTFFQGPDSLGMWQPSRFKAVTNFISGSTTIGPTLIGGYLPPWTGLLGNKSINHIITGWSPTTGYMDLGEGGFFSISRIGGVSGVLRWYSSDKNLEELLLEDVPGNLFFESSNLRTFNICGYTSTTFGFKAVATGFFERSTGANTNYDFAFGYLPRGDRYLYLRHLLGNISSNFTGSLRVIGSTGSYGEEILSGSFLIQNRNILSGYTGLNLEFSKKSFINPDNTGNFINYFITEKNNKFVYTGLLGG